jgi:hypothetical protein
MSMEATTMLGNAVPLPVARAVLAELRSAA